MTDEDIYAGILQHVGTDTFSNWYVGITNNIDSRLFGDHAVSREYGHWYHAPALDSDHSRSAEQALLNLGFDGGNGGGDNTAVFVYAFRKDLGTVR